MASETRVRVTHRGTQIADHKRCYDKRQRIDDNEHIDALAAHKRRAQASVGQDRLLRDLPNARALCQTLVERRIPLGPQIQVLIRLLDQYGPDALRAAVDLALERATIEASSIKRIIEKARQQAGEPPLRPLRLPTDRADLHEPSVKNHSLEDYDNIGETHDAS